MRSKEMLMLFRMQCLYLEQEHIRRDFWSIYLFLFLSFVIIKLLKPLKVFMPCGLILQEI